MSAAESPASPAAPGATPPASASGTASVSDSTEGAAGHPAPSPAADFSLALLAEFVALGVTDAVLTPGSRSQALALALAELDRARLLDLQVRIDERVAGFTALGLAAETGRPAIVVTTSGTAVANLMPAVLEAHHSRVPMLLITSDRPAAMRGTAGNQTTWQPDIFGRFVRHSVDIPAPTGDPAELASAASLARSALDAALGTRTGDPGPVHLNLQLREPLSGAVPDLVALLAAGEWMPGAAAVPTAPADAAPAAGAGATLVLARGPRTAVIAGHDAGPEAEELAHHGGWPLIAEPSSGSRYGRNLIVAYREVLADPELGGRVERAIVFGHPTLSREVPALSLREGVETIVVVPAAAGLPAGEQLVDAYNPGHRVHAFAAAVEVAPLPRAARWPSGGAPIAASNGTPATTAATTPPTETAATTPPTAAAATNAPTADAASGVVDGALRTTPASDAIDARTADEAASAAAERAWLRDWVLASRAIVEAQSADEPIPAPNIEFANSPDIAERRAYRLAETAALKAPITRRTLALAVWQATWPHDRLVLGASRLIRDLDRAVAGKKIRVHANRGLAGIDGTIATAAGIALASQRAPLPPLPAAPATPPEAASTPDAATSAASEPGARASADQTARQAATLHGVTRVLLGDLTLLHDAGALLFGTGERRPRIQLIVANDGGGTIFDTLEVASTADRAAFDRVMLTPQTVDLEALARAYGWDYTRATTRVELDRALTAPLTGPTLLEVPLTR